MFDINVSYEKSVMHAFAIFKTNLGTAFILQPRNSNDLFELERLAEKFRNKITWLLKVFIYVINFFFVPHIVPCQINLFFLSYYASTKDKDIFDFFKINIILIILILEDNIFFFNWICLKQF